MAWLSERKTLFVIGIAAILFNLAPYLYQVSHPVSGMTYVGSFPNPMDVSVYLSEMHDGYDGKWGAVDRFTSEPQQPVYLHSLYFLLGHISKIVGLSIQEVFFLSRFLCGLLLILASVYCVRTVVKSLKIRQYAYLFLFFGAGLGVLVRGSLDMWILDAMPMVRFSGFPHFTLGDALLITVLALFYRYSDDAKVWRILVAGVLTATLTIVMPYHSVLLYPLVGVFMGVLVFQNPSQWKRIVPHACIYLLISLPSFLFIVAVSFQNQPITLVQRLTVLEYASPLLLFSGYAFSWVFYVFGVRAMGRESRKAAMAVLCWLAIAVFMMYFAPIAQKRRLFETGTFIPLSIGAAYGLSAVEGLILRWGKLRSDLVKNSMHAVIAVVIASFFLLGNASAWYRFQEYYHDLSPGALPPFIPNENIAAINWLEKNTRKDSIILSSFANGNMIPAIAARTVFIGHSPNTVKLQAKAMQAILFFSGKESPAEMQNFLKRERIDYVFTSSFEKGSLLFTPEKYQFLSRVYESDGVEIYEVATQKTAAWRR